jgi:hypothetical protein
LRESLFSVTASPQLFGRDFPEFGFSVAAAAERDEVLEEVRILSGEPLRLDIPSNRDDMVAIRIAAELLTSHATDHALMIVSGKRSRPDVSPATPI